MDASINRSINLSQLVLPYPIGEFCPILVCFILFYPNLSYLILSYPILSYPILSILSIHLGIYVFVYCTTQGFLANFQYMATSMSSVQIREHSKPLGWSHSKYRQTIIKWWFNGILMGIEASGFIIWLVVWNILKIFPWLLGIVIPIDGLIFFRGVGLNHQPAIVCPCLSHEPRVPCVPRQELFVMAMKDSLGPHCCLDRICGFSSWEHHRKPMAFTMLLLHQR